MTAPTAAAFIEKLVTDTAFTSELMEQLGDQPTFANIAKLAAERGYSFDEGEYAKAKLDHEKAQATAFFARVKADDDLSMRFKDRLSGAPQDQYVDTLIKFAGEQGFNFSPVAYLEVANAHLAERYRPTDGELDEADLQKVVGGASAGSSCSTQPRSSAPPPQSSGPGWTQGNSFGCQALGLPFSISAARSGQRQLCGV